MGCNMQNTDCRSQTTAGMQPADRFKPILNHVLSDRHLEQKAEFASAGGIPCVCRAQCAHDTRDVSLPDFGVFPIIAYSLLAILLKWMGLHKEHYPLSVKNS